jgi:uncharacterized protein YcbX
VLAGTVVDWPGIVVVVVVVVVDSVVEVVLLSEGAVVDAPSAPAAWNGTSVIAAASRVIAAAAGNRRMLLPRAVAADTCPRFLRHWHTNVNRQVFNCEREGPTMAPNDVTVASMWRYPVKSMLGEAIATVAIGARGLAGDRAYALVDVETGFVVSAKNPRRWGMLFECAAEYLEAPDANGAPPPVRITLPDGTTVRSDDAGVDAALSEALGRAVRLQTTAPETPIIEDLAPDVEDIPAEERGTIHRGQIALLSPPGAFFDAAPLHVLTTSSLAAVSASYPAGAFDPMRFRPNVLIDSGAGDGYVENAWVGSPLRLGTDIVIDIVMSVPRCVMTTLPQGALPADKGILQAIGRENRFDVPGLGVNSCLGVYGMVSAGGTVAVGDPVVIGPS